jgi:hypothetical protein
MLVALECIVCAAIAVFFCCSIARLRRRNAQSWESLLARLRVDWSARELSDLCCPLEGRTAGPAEKWRRIRGARGLWALFQNAGVMMEIADYAIRNSDGADRELLANLRSDAMQTRLYVLKTTGAFACGLVEDSICAQALRAEAVFLEMELSMSEFLQAGAPDFAQGFSAAM